MLRRAMSWSVLLTHTRPQTRKRLEAWSVDTGRGQRGVWTLAEASVECRVMSGATATAADETSYAEQRDGARGGDGKVQHRSDFRAAVGKARIHIHRE